jgi:integrase
LAKNLIDPTPRDSSARRNAASTCSTDPLGNTRDGLQRPKSQHDDLARLPRPDLVKAAIDGRLPYGMGIARLADLPAEWGKFTRKTTSTTVVNRTVPRRPPNSELRPREYLTEKEIERLQEAARKRSRYGHRDATMILVAYRHGLRASEVCNLRWDQIELGSGRLHVRRAKGGIDNVHPLSGREIRELRQLRRENTESRYVFVTERGGPVTTAGFLKTIARTGEAAKIPFPIHPHMLRHSTGFKLANDGHDTRALQHYMGHKNIMHTVRYTEMAPDRFKNFWKD